MRIGLRLLLGFFAVLGLALFVVLRVFVEEVKPGTRLAMEDALVDTAHSLAALAATDMKAGNIASGGFAAALGGLRELRLQTELSGFRKTRVDLRVSITDAAGTVVFDTEPAAIGQDHSRWNDVLRTLRGGYGARSSPASPDQPELTVMHVAAPIRDGDRIIGVLTVSRPNQTLQPYIDRSRDRILQAAWLLLGVSLCAGLLFTGWIASSLQRLQAYAQAVARGERALLPRMGRFSGNTEFSDLAQALERMRLKLEDKAYVEHYVHTLTHELKSPLAAIRGAAELLQEPLPDAERERFAAHIQRQTGRLQQLIDRLLDLAAVEQMRSLQDVAPVDLAALSRERLQALEPRLLRKRLRVRDELGPGATVRGNRFLLQQALHNLLDNAIEFSPAGGELLLRLQPAGARVQWLLRDQGPGVPDYARGRIFERFYSLPRSDTQERSSGLGLCLVREVNELHGGELEVGNVQTADDRAVPADRAAAGEAVATEGAQATGFEVRWRLPA